MSRILKTISHDISRGFLIAFIALLIVIPGAILFVVLLYENQQRDVSDAFLIIASVVWMSVFLGGLWLFMVTTQRRRRKWLDSVFTPLGLTGHRFMINWWEYRGTFMGRDLTTRFYKGPTLDLILSTSLRTRFGVSTPNELGGFVADRLKKPPLLMLTPERQGMTAHALDEDWFTHLLDSPELVGCLERLLKAGDSWALIRQVILTPGRLQLTLYRNQNLFNYDFTAEEVRNWVGDLFTVLQIAEREPEPLITSEETNLERDARSGKLSRRVILIFVGVLLLFGVCFGLALWFLVRYAG